MILLKVSPPIYECYLYHFWGFCAKTLRISTNSSLYSIFSFFFFFWAVDSCNQRLSISLCVFIQCQRQWGCSWLGTTIVTTVRTTCSHLHFDMKICKISAGDPSLMWNNTLLQHQKLGHLYLKKFICMITSAHCVLLRGRSLFMNASEELAHRYEYE